MAVYYNEFDAFAAAWLRELIADGLIPDGDVDERSIADVEPPDLKGYTQAHFFAGIGGWEYALKLAGWEGPVWTGSCPCQPFSQAGKRKGTSDERHLWPVWRDLIAECRPPVVFGEQVASSLGREWLSGVRAEMEALGYEVGAADLCAASVGAPHIRQRLFWVAYTEDAIRRVERDGGESGNHHQAERTTQGRGTQDGGSGQFGEHCAAGGLAYGATDRRQQERQDGPGSAERAEAEGRAAGLGLRGAPGGLANTNRRGCGKERQSRELSQIRGGGADEWVQVKSTSTCFWHPYDVIPCADGKARRIEPSTFPLAHGVPNRVGRLRAYGNAIIPQVAATFVRAFMEADKASTSAEQAERAGGA